MNTNEFEAWLSRNIKNVGKGGKRPSIDPFNKAMKGGERNTRAAEYPCKDVEEYHHYSERFSQKKEDDDKQNDNTQSNSEQSRQNSGSSRGRVTRNLISRVAAVAIGAVVVVSGYQTMQANAAKNETSPAVAEISYNWSEIAKSGTGTGTETGVVKLLDENGRVFKEVPATVTVEKADATCNQEGRITYTTTVEYNGETITDTRYETIPALKHEFDEGKEVVLDDGKTAVVFECTHCHEQYIISTTIDEE